MRSFIICTLRQIFWDGQMKEGEIMCRMLGRYEMHKSLFSENLKGRDQLQDLSVDTRIILYCNLKKYDVNIFTGFN
jgi:hypothetical protein